MSGLASSCRRCGRPLSTTPVEVEHLAWSDAERVTAQGWLGRTAEHAVGVECLTPDETNFLQPERIPPAVRTNRFQRSPGYVTDWSLA